MNPVVIATFADEVPCLDRFCRSAYPSTPRSELTAVGLEHEAHEALLRLGYRSKNTLPYLDNVAHRSVFLAAARMAQEWWRALPATAIRELTHDNIVYPEMLEYDTSVFLTDVLIQLECVKGVLSRERPDALIVAENPPAPVCTVMMGSRERFVHSMAQQLSMHFQTELLGVPRNPVEQPQWRRLKAALGALPDLFCAVRLAEDPLRLFMDAAIPQVVNRVGVGTRFVETKLADYSRAERKVVFWNELRSKRALYEHLKRSSDTAVAILSDDGDRRFKRSCIPRLDPRTMQDPAVEGAFLCARRKGEMAWSEMVADSGFQETLQYGGVKLWPALAPRLRYYVTEHYPSCVRFYEGVCAFLRRYGGDVLVSSIDVYGFTPWIYQAFSRMGRSSIYLWHGLTIPNATTEEGLRPCFLPLHARRMGAFGTAIASWYVGQGVEEERISVVGFPDMGADFGALSGHERRRRCRILDVSPDKPIVIYAAGVTRYGGRRAYSEETADEILRATRDVLQELGNDPDLQLILKIHPGMSLEERRTYCQAAAAFPRVRVWQMPSLTRMLPLCEILITYQSSAGIEALAYDKHVVIYNTTGRVNQFTPYAMKVDDPTTNFFLLVDTPRELRPVVHRLLTDQELNSRLRRKREEVDPFLLHNRDGRATTRALRMLEGTWRPAAAAVAQHV